LDRSGGCGEEPAWSILSQNERNKTHYQQNQIQKYHKKKINKFPIEWILR